MPVTATASPTGRPSNPHALSIENEVAIPGAAPPGATIVTAVEASVTRVEWTNERPGSAAIHGGPFVRALRGAAATSATIHCHERSLTTSQTWP